MSDAPTTAPDDVRLPRQLVPSSYRVTLEPDLAASRFDGWVELGAAVHPVTDRLTLHAADLEIRSAEVRDGTGTVSAIAELDVDDELVVLRLERPVTGAVTISVTYSGVINEHLQGMYRSTFPGEDGAERVMASTQLFATDARRVFPCVDEPAYKATFEVTAVVDDGLVALSNSSAAEERRRPDGRREVRFRPTIPMSTYLVALVVGPLERTEAVDVDGVALSVACTPGKRRLGRLALEVGAFALRFYRDYFGLDYPGDKVDLVGVPDFAYGAMENLGCVTFRETALLVDEATATPEELRRVAMVVAHELAHMWFGDLVTMAWWEGLWLNEAFATFMAALCVDAYQPSLCEWQRFHEERERGLEIDGLHTTRPIEYPVRTAVEALDMVDAITYQKGSAVLRMLEQFLGPDVYRDGIRRYLAEHAYGNTVTGDLWTALEAVSGEPVAAIMDSWILQGGHPVVWCRDGQLTQAPFAFGAPDGPSNIGTTWRVPVRARSLASGEEATVVLDDAPATVELAAPVLANTGAGVYRTGYDAAAFGALRSQGAALGELGRAALLADTWALCRAGDAPLADVLGLVEDLEDAVEPAAWQTAARVVGTLERLVAPGQRPAFEALVRRITAPVAQRLGWGAEDPDGKAAIVRPLALGLLGAPGADEGVRAESLARFEDGRDDGPLADAVLETVAAVARPRDRVALLERMAGAPDPQAEERYRIGLATFRDRDACLDLFERCFDLFRTQDVAFVLRLLLVNPAGGRDVWDRLEASWDATMSRVPEQLHSIVVVGVTAFYDDAALAARAAAFVAEHPVPIGQRRVVQGLETLRHGVAFATSAAPQLASILT